MRKQGTYGNESAGCIGEADGDCRAAHPPSVGVHGDEVGEDNHKRQNELDAKALPGQYGIVSYTWRRSAVVPRCYPAHTIQTQFKKLYRIYF